MRILIIHNQLWAHYKSVLFEAIHKNLAARYPSSSLKVAQIALYEKSRENMLADKSQNEYNYPYKVLFQRSLDTVGALERTRALFQEFNTFKPDVLNITGYFDIAQVLLMAYAKFRGIKVVISSESSEVDKTRSLVKESLKKLILGMSDAFFCFGTSTVSYLKTLGIDSGKIVVTKAAVVDNQQLLHQYLSTKQGITPDRKHNFIYVGRLAQEKNLNTLVSAYMRCQQSANDPDAWGLMIVGDGPEREPLEAFVRDLGLTNVKFIGGVSWKAVPDFLAHASVLILPSYSEPWGLVVNEALVCGIPVIVSEKCGCAMDLVEPDGNGFIFDPTDERALHEAMQFYINHPEEIINHGIRSKELIEPFSPQSVAVEMIKAYHHLVEQKSN